MHKQNIFIVFDGLDGSGKGEVIARTHNYLFFSDVRYRILTTREPTAGQYGMKIREMLQNQKDPIEDAEYILKLYVKDREEHLKTLIEPFFSAKTTANHNLVLCDRYYYSTMAFQSTQGIPLDKIISMNDKFLKPDLALILDLPAQTALKRIEAGRDLKEKFEQLAFMKKLRDNFLNLNRFIDDNIKVIDASKSKENVFEQVKKEIDGII